VYNHSVGIRQGISTTIAERISVLRSRVALKLFGAILERDGRFEVISYQNA
jgi:hypothetical protein